MRSCQTQMIRSEPNGKKRMKRLLIPVSTKNVSGLLLTQLMKNLAMKSMKTFSMHSHILWRQGWGWKISFLPAVKEHPQKRIKGGKQQRVAPIAQLDWISAQLDEIQNKKGCQQEAKATMPKTLSTIVAPAKHELAQLAKCMSGSFTYTNKNICPHTHEFTMIQVWH